MNFYEVTGEEGNFLVSQIRCLETDELLKNPIPICTKPSENDAMAVCEVFEDNVLYYN